MYNNYLIHKSFRSLNFDEIEEIVKRIKESDTIAKEELMKEFDIIISCLISKTFIPGYDLEDLRNECYVALFNAVENYNIDQHTFVGYSVQAIKNHVNALLVKIKRKENLLKKFQSILVDTSAASSPESVDENLIYESSYETFIEILENLTDEEKDMLVTVILRHYPLKYFAVERNFSYSTAAKRRQALLKKIKKHFDV